MGSLFSQLKIDAKNIVEAGGFNNSITISKNGVSYTCEGLTPSHHTRVDPDGYNEIAGEKASITFHVENAVEEGFITTDDFDNMEDYIVTFQDNNGVIRSYAVNESRPDYSTSTITLFLGKALSGS